MHENYEIEVKYIRNRIVIMALSLAFLCAFFLPGKAEAATADNKAGMISVSGNSLNVRSSPSTGAAKVASLPKGSFVTLISKSGSWWQVEYAKGQYGYCHADYISLVSATNGKVQTQSGSLNVRSGAGTSYGKVGSLYKGENVLVLSNSGSWSRILFHGTKTGYVSSQYLSATMVSNPAVSLWLRNFKQMDERWRDVTIGTSGKTFSQIGCATTAIAMIEGHRTGKLIYPDVMAQQLKYTPSGSVYWPSHYTTVTNGTNLLIGIYNRLKQGKPILYGATNAYGGQHWVVITGFSGGDVNNAANFTIHDPGTYNRTNLKQFMELYPNFYKYFFY